MSQFYPNPKLQRPSTAQGRKSANEKFAGSLYSMSVEAFVPATGRGVQVRCA